MPKIVLSHTRIGFVLGSGYKYQTPAIEKINQSNTSQLLFSAPATPQEQEQSRSRRVLQRVWLHRSDRPPLLVCKYHHDLYFCSYGCIDPVDLLCDSGISQLSILAQFKYGCIDLVDPHYMNQIKVKLSALPQNGSLWQIH